jgi:hypothetical protein
MIPFSVFPYMLVAQGLDPTVFPQSAGLTANLAGMEGLLYGGFDALVNGVIRMVHMDTQPAKLLFHLQHFKLASACLLEFGDQRFQILAEPHQYVEPAIVIREAPGHRCVPYVTRGVEPTGPTLNQTLLKFLCAFGKLLSPQRREGSASSSC